MASSYVRKTHVDACSKSTPFIKRTKKFTRAKRKKFANFAKVKRSLQNMTLSFTTQPTTRFNANKKIVNLLLNFKAITKHIRSAT